MSGSPTAVVTTDDLYWFIREQLSKHGEDVDKTSAY